MREFFKSVWTDHTTGQYSSSKVWYSIANVVATVIVLKMTYNNTLTIDFFIAYLGVVGGHSAFSNFISRKYSTPQDKVVEQTSAL